MHIGAINMNDVNNLNFFILSTRYNPKNYCLCGIPMDFHQRLRLYYKDLLEIVYVTSTIYMIHNHDNNVPTVVSACILSSVYQNLGYFEITYL